MIEEISYPNTDETITDRLTDKDVPPPPGPPEWVSETYPKGEEVITAEVTAEDPDINATVQLKPDHGLKARRFLDLVASGVKPSEAAYKLQGTVGDFCNSVELRDALKKLVDTARLPAEVRKEMVRSGLNSIFLRNIQGKLKEQKIALQAAQQISKDPEIGLNMPNIGPSVVINMDALGTMMQNMKPIEGLEEIPLAPTPPEEKE